MSSSSSGMGVINRKRYRGCLVLLREFDFILYFCVRAATHRYNATDAARARAADNTRGLAARTAAAVAAAAAAAADGPSPDSLAADAAKLSPPVTQAATCRLKIQVVGPIRLQTLGHHMRCASGDAATTCDPVPSRSR